jgi:hypothetical protein
MAANRHDHHDHDRHLPDYSRPENRFEHRDVNVWAVYKFGIALALLCVVSFGLLFGLYRYFLAREGGAASQQKMNVDARDLPPLPRLQSAPIQDLREMRAAEDSILGGYGWVDQQHGVVRIPIDRAIDLLAQRGLASRPQAGPQSASAGVSVPTESGLGPKMQQPGGPLAGEVTK